MLLQLQEQHIVKNIYIIHIGYTAKFWLELEKLAGSNLQSWPFEIKLSISKSLNYNF